jgi:aconitase A
MMEQRSWRSTFGNIRLLSQHVSKEGGYTVHFPEGEETTAYEASAPCSSFTNLT